MPLHPTVSPSSRTARALAATALATGLVWALTVPSPARAQSVTPAFTYQGELRSAGNAANGSFDMEFRLYDDAAAGAQVGPTVTRNAVVVAQGLFAVLLDFGAAQFAGDRQWLEVRIRATGGTFETLSPRSEVTATPYALAAVAALANSVTGTSIVDGSVQSGDLAAGAVGSAQINSAQVQRRVGAACASGSAIRSVAVDGTVTCETALQGPVGPQGPAGPTGPTGLQGPIGPQGPSGSADAWSRTGNAGTNSASNFIGTTDAQAFEIRTANARSLRIEPSSITFGTPAVPITTNTIGGSSANNVSAGVRGATIAGGGLPLGNSDPVFDVEAPNRITDHYGTVGGGLNNRAGDDTGTQEDGAFATVGGGRGNRATAQYSTIGGGLAQDASGDYSTIGGGIGHNATGNYSTVAGGEVGSATGTYSSVGGGYFGAATGAYSTVGGGENNSAIGSFSTVGGGRSNTASGFLSTVGGGDDNCAGSSQSWAGGRRAKVRPSVDPGGTGSCAGLGIYPGGIGDAGTFVWADSQSADFISTGDNQFLVRAQGGMAINTNTPTAGAALTVNGTMSFGSATGQMLDLFGANDYGIGVQGSRLYFRTNNGFSWFEGGVHNDTADNPGAGGTLRMRLSNTGQLQTTTGTISALSDARLKDQVHDYTDALDRINALRPVTYHYIAGGKAPFQPEGIHIGFVAQELQQVFPDWVSQGDDGYLMLSMRGFEAVAVRAIQELSAENEALRKRLDAIEARLEGRR